MYTSCGWFFDEISGIETVQVIMYAARAMQLAHELFGLELESGYTDFLARAPSNIQEFENGAKIYSIFVKPAIVDFAKMCAQNTIIELFADDVKGLLTSKLPNSCFKITANNFERRDDGKFRLLVNRSTVYSNITLDEEAFGCTALWLGDHNVCCGAEHNMSEQNFNTIRDNVLACFDRGQINEIIVILSNYYQKNVYSLKDMFRDDQRHILNNILADELKKVKENYDFIYNYNSAMLRFMKETGIPSPKPLRSAAEVALNLDLVELLSSETLDLDKLRRVGADSKLLSVTLDYELLALKASERIADEFKKLLEAPENIETIKLISQLIQMTRGLPIKLNLWQSQNAAFKIAETQYKKMKEKNDELSKAWVSAFTKLSELIGIRLD
jgi:hypothetical protein